MDDRRQKLSRRNLVAGAGTAGALAAVVAVLPQGQGPTAQSVAPNPTREQGGGYRESAHVLRYYQTTRI